MWYKICENPIRTNATVLYYCGPGAPVVVGTGKGRKPTLHPHLKIMFLATKFRVIV